MKKKRALFFIINAAICLLCLGILLYRYLDHFKPQLDALRANYQADNNAFWLSEIDKVNFRFISEFMIIWAVINISSLLLNIFNPLLIGVRKRNIIVLAVLFPIAVGIIIAAFLLSDNLFILKSGYYVFLAYMVFLLAIYAFSKNKAVTESPKEAKLM